MPQGLRAAITSKTPVAMAALCAAKIANSDNDQKLAEGKSLVSRSVPLFSNKRRGAMGVLGYFSSYKVSLATAEWTKPLIHGFYKQSITLCLCLSSP